MLTVTVRFDFDAAHRIVGHKGRCRHIHGHTYKAEVTVAAPALNSLDMVEDFSILKGLIGNWITFNWDHNLLLNRDDPQAKHLNMTEERQPFFFHANPTAEVMAQFLFDKSQELLPSPLRVLSVHLYESEKTFASCWGKSDNEMGGK
jgi:6-pyruvoyltetrahydropterin/6-carboxytetrahydropterin synthase